MSEQRKKEIRAVFEEVGGDVTMRRFAGHLVEHGVFTITELGNMAIPQIMAIARDALGAPDERGLPFAIPQRPAKRKKGEPAEEDDGPKWGQLGFALLDDLKYNLETKGNAISGDLRGWYALRDYTQQTYNVDVPDRFHWKPD